MPPTIRRPPGDRPESTGDDEVPDGIERAIAAARNRPDDVAVALGRGTDRRKFVAWGGDQWYGCVQARERGRWRTVEWIAWNDALLRTALGRSLTGEDAWCYPLPREAAPIPGE